MIRPGSSQSNATDSQPKQKPSRPSWNSSIKNLLTKKKPSPSPFLSPTAESDLAISKTPPPPSPSIKPKKPSSFSRKAISNSKEKSSPKKQSFQQKPLPTPTPKKDITPPTQQKEQKKQQPSTQQLTLQLPVSPQQQLPPQPAILKRFTQTPQRRVQSLASTISSRSERPGVSSTSSSMEKLNIYETNEMGMPKGRVERFESVLEGRNLSDRELRESLRAVRRLVLVEGVPDTYSAEGKGFSVCSLRGRVWKVFLSVYRINANEYIGFVERGKSEVYEKIKNDAFRTLKTDQKFLEKVNVKMLSRILNAFAWKSKDQPSSRLINLKYSYVQGMNVLAAPFLFVMPELDAFFSFSSFIQHTCPLYVQPALEGVHCGLKLLDKCLKIVDIELFNNLKGKKLTAEVYAFPSIMTFSACTQPLTEVLKLWDFYFAFGFHLNILAIISQLVLIRTELMESPTPNKILRTFPDIDSKKILSVTLGMVSQIPDDLYDMLVRHCYDPMIYDVIME